MQPTYFVYLFVCKSCFFIFVWPISTAMNEWTVQSRMKFKRIASLTNLNASAVVAKCCLFPCHRHHLRFHFGCMRCCIDRFSHVFSFYTILLWYFAWNAIWYLVAICNSPLYKMIFCFSNTCVEDRSTIELGAVSTHHKNQCIGFGCLKHGIKMK